jgi:hypothetical protein
VQFVACRRCGVSKPRDSVYFARSQTVKDGLTTDCRECRRERDRTNQWKRYRKFGDDSLLQDLVESVTECVICGATERLLIDHCHDKERVRGVLCHWCNLGLGHFKDDPELLEMAAQYVREMGAILERKE